MSTKLDLTREPADFEKFGRIVWDQLNTVALSSGNPVAATHIAVQSALILANKGADTALSAGTDEAADEHLDRLLGHFRKGAR